MESRCMAGTDVCPEQFLSSNINKRTHEYGGSSEKCCKFGVDLMEALKEAVGEDRLAIRLTPFGLYNEARGTQRVETLSYLCRELKARINLSYVHFIELDTGKYVV
jgi:2,4-dienoyl-CoA reductase-like NADH-dependent reductase (Old Yellow Enzyme family)